MQPLPEIELQHNLPTISGRQLHNASMAERLKAAAAVMNGGCVVAGLSGRKTARLVGVNRSLVGFAHRTGMDAKLLEGSVSVIDVVVAWKKAKSSVERADKVIDDIGVEAVIEVIAQRLVTEPNAVAASLLVAFGRDVMWRVVDQLTSPGSATE